MSDKVFDKADLLVVFDEDPETAKPIGSFNTIHKVGQGDMFANDRRHHDVRALTRVMFCEKMRFAVVEQRVTVTDFGMSALKAEHPYRRESNTPRLMLLRGRMCHNSADLTREAVRIADEWRDEMSVHVPDAVIDLTKEEDHQSPLIEEAPATPETGNEDEFAFGLTVEGAQVAQTIDVMVAGEKVSEVPMPPMPPARQSRRAKQKAEKETK